jgi:membrane fusion protein, heavy metal efflux system
MDSMRVQKLLRFNETIPSAPAKEACPTPDAALRLPIGSRLTSNQLGFHVFKMFMVPLIVVSLTSCNRLKKAGGEGSHPEEAKVEEIHGNGVVEVDHPEQFQLAEVVQRKTMDEVNVTGVVAPDVSRSVPVLSLSGGRAVEIRVRLGDEVKKGQVLLTLSSPDVEQALSDYQKAVADERMARPQLERSQDLFAKGAMAKHDLEAAANAEQKAQVDVATAKQHVAILGGDIDNPSSLIPIRAPISGAIVEQNVTSGTGVRSLDNSPNLFTIADLSAVWVLCDVYENDLARVHLGDSAAVRLNAFPDRTFHARVGNISQVLDPSTRSAKVRLELPNPGRLIRAGMFATATFRSQGGQTHPVAPTAAIMRLHDKDWVFTPLGGNRFQRREVQVGPASSDGFQVIVSGLAGGDKVVANALQFSSAAGME